MNNLISAKQFVLGIDGMDPKLTRKYIAKGLMPNTKHLIERGSARADLTMLGGHPTVTPPQWTSLACGCWPATHGITDFSYHYRPEEVKKHGLGLAKYGLDSRLCEAEQVWNVFAEAGKKTLVAHWPGSSWPPSSDSPNLHVIDGTQPGCINMGVAEVDKEFILVGSNNNTGATYKAKAASNSKIPCVITDLEIKDTGIVDLQDNMEAIKNESEKEGIRQPLMILLNEKDASGSLGLAPFDVVFTEIKPADEKWKNAPQGAKEFIILFSKGTVHQNGLILPNDNGVFDTIALYENKKQEMPYAVLRAGEFVSSIPGKAIRNEQSYEVVRNMRILDLAQDGNSFRIWISAAMDINNDSVWHPRYLYKQVVDNIGFPCSESNLGGTDKQLILDCMVANWGEAAKWQAAAINLLLQKEKYEIVFSHFHNIDAEMHMIAKFMKHRPNSESPLGEADYAEILEKIYMQTDKYIGEFLHLLDEDWTVYLVSDHAIVCPEHGQRLLGDFGLNVPIMRELGFTELLKDENGNDLRQIDWSKTKAINSGIYIQLNIKGRTPYGIVEPEDQYELEEEIITALYGYKDPITHKRIVSLALRKKDAIILGLGGDGCADIVIQMAEGYNIDHADCLTTTEGYADTSMAPIFVAAGKGIKSGYTTKRYIKQIDLAPTMAALGGVRMPKDCEGAPIYQIMENIY